MKDFNYFAPTEVEFGVKAEDKLGALIMKYKEAGKVLLVYGGGSVIRSGLLDRVKKQIASLNIETIELGGVKPNPRLALVRKGVEICKSDSIALILAVGGGSVIDTSKAISYGAKYKGDVWDFFIGKAQAQSAIPVGCVLTIPAAGSEMSDGCVISNEDTQQKLGYSSNVGRLKFAIMNPLLTYTLPDYQTACGAVDIMMHTMERYFTKDTDMLVQTALAESLLKIVKESADLLLCHKQTLSEDETLQARSTLMWASSLSHNDLTGSRNSSDFATHKIEHELSALFDVAHGAGLSAVWSSWARYVVMSNPERFASFATKVLSLPASADVMETATRGIAEMEDVYRNWGMPVGIQALIGRKASEEEILLMAKKCTKDNTFHIGYFQSLSKEDVVNILRLANEID